MINDYMFFSLVIYIPIAIGIILFGEYVILILFSNKFLQLIPVLSWFIMAEYLHNLQRPLGQTVVGLAALRIHAIGSIFVILCWVLIPVFFISRYGLKSIAFGYAFGTLCYMIVSIVYLKKMVRLVATRRNIMLGVIGFILVIIVSIITINILIKPFILLAVLMSLFPFLNKQEKLKMYRMLGKWS